MRTTLNNRRMTAEEVRKLRDGALVTVRRDPKFREAKAETICYRVSTRNGLKVLIEKGTGAMKTIKERPGRLYFREGGY